MNFETKLSRAARDFDAGLKKLLAVRRPAAPKLMEAINYAALGPGKRLRPFLVIESCALFDIPFNRALPTAAALECIHCYSLVHDDLPAMDDDDLRRGRATVHIAFDEATAILAGDALQSLAFEIISSPETHSDAAIRAQLVNRLAKAAGTEGMAGGQMQDILSDAVTANLDDITKLQQLKTGALIEYACIAGAILADASEEDHAALTTYARNIGLAFQITDDLLDLEGTADTIGKRTGKDDAAGKTTFVSLLGADRARAKAANLIDDAVSALRPFGPSADTLRDTARFILKRQR